MSASTDDGRHGGSSPPVSTQAHNDQEGTTMGHDTPYTSPEQRKLGAAYYMMHRDEKDVDRPFVNLQRTEQFEWTKRCGIHRSVREWLHNDERLIRRIDVVGVAKKIFEFYPGHLATTLPHDVIFELIESHDADEDDAVPVESLARHDWVEDPPDANDRDRVRGGRAAARVTS